jgi:hypothetical protein
MVQWDVPADGGRCGVGFGDTVASDGNIPFAYDLALDAARDLHALAAAVRSHQHERASAADTARVHWTGPHRVQFDDRTAAEDRDAAGLAAAIEETARQIARSWAAARGNQDRINAARRQDHEEANRYDGEFVLVEYGHKVADSVAGVFGHGTDQPPPPGDPPVPQPPLFAPTRAPLHPEHEHPR